MARKRTEKKMPSTKSESELRLKPVRLDLDPEMHRLLRLLAADADVSMAYYARESLCRFMREEAKRKGLK